MRARARGLTKPIFNDILKYSVWLSVLLVQLVPYHIWFADMVLCRTGIAAPWMGFFFLVCGNYVRCNKSIMIIFERQIYHLDCRTCTMLFA